MRFVISADNCETLVLRSQVPGNEIGYWILQDGIHGWFGTPDVRESPIERKMSDGELFPPKITQGARVLTIDACAVCESALEAAKVIDHVNAFVGKKLTIVGEDANGPRTVYGFLAEDPSPEYRYDDVVMFTLIVQCPDPYKYSEWMAFAQSGTKVDVINNGNVPSYPKVHAEGSSMSYLTLTYNSQQVSWTGSADTLDIDFADMAPSTGTVSVDNAFAIDPGAHSVTVSSNGTVTLYVRSAWR